MTKPSHNLYRLATLLAWPVWLVATVISCSDVPGEDGGPNTDNAPPVEYVWPNPVRLLPGSSRPLTVESFAPKLGIQVLAGSTAWSASDTTIATIDAAGIVHPIRNGQLFITATRGDTVLTASVVVASYQNQLTFTDVGVANGGGCALDTAGVPWCWGPYGRQNATQPADGCEGTQLPNSFVNFYPYRVTSTCSAVPVKVATVLLASMVPVPSSVVDASPYALSTSGHFYHMNGTGPTDLLGGTMQFSSILPGNQTCAVAIDGRGYCWGSGILGTGIVEPLLGLSTPQELADGLRWTSIVHATSMCGLTTTGQAYCWGLNPQFSAGVGPDSATRPGCTSACVLAPAAVQTTEQFVTIAANNTDVCGISTNGGTYCWGPLPPTVTEPHATSAGHPIPVASAPQFVSLSGVGSVCGIDGTGTAYCLNKNAAATDVASVYSFVALPLPFPVKKISTGSVMSCAISASDNRLYCWGTGVLGGASAEKSADAAHPIEVAGQRPPT